MKKIYSILIGLLLLTTLQGQILKHSNYVAPPSTPPAGYYEEYETIHNYFATPPSSLIAGYQNDLIYSLDTLDFAGGASVWDRMDLFYMIASHDSVDAYVNWASPGDFTLTNPGTTTYDWIQWSGISGSGDDYLSTGYTPSSSAINASQNSTTIGVWVGGAAFNASYYIYGASVTAFPAKLSRMRPRVSGNLSGYVNASDGSDMATATSVGLSMFVRRGASETEFYKNGTSIGADTDASAGLPTVPIFLLVDNRDGTPTGYTVGTIRVFFILNAVTDTEADLINDILNTYINAIGG